MYLPFGINGSQFAWSDADTWAPNEIEDAFVGLANLPHWTLPRERVKKLIRFHRGYVRDPDVRLGNGWIETLANTRIELFDAWARSDRVTRRKTVTHEIAHHLERDLPPTVSRQWLAIAGWRAVGQDPEQRQYAQDDSVANVSWYAAHSPMEDLAETAAMYRYSPRALFAAFPARFAFVRDNLFQGVDYLSEGACVASQTWKESPR
jgi:hypothetical protein